MKKPPQHHLRCLQALGYPLPYIVEHTHPDVELWETPGHVPAGEAVKAMERFYKQLGERAATVEGTGLSRSRIRRTLLKAQDRGWLPPFAFDEDDDGNHVGDGHKDAVRPPEVGVMRYRADDRVAAAAFAIAKTILSDKYATLGDVAKVHGVTRVAEEISDFELRDMRNMEPQESVIPGRGWTDPVKAKRLWSYAAAVEIGELDPFDAWKELTGKEFERRDWSGKKGKKAAAAEPEKVAA